MLAIVHFPSILWPSKEKKREREAMMEDAICGLYQPLACNNAVIRFECLK